MSNARIYHNPRCSKSRAALELLRSRGVEPVVVPYLEGAVSERELRELLKLLQLPAHDIVRRSEPEYEDLGLTADLPEQAIVAALAAHPKLIERPIVVVGTHAIVARPPERVLELLDRAAGVAAGSSHNAGDE